MSDASAAFGPSDQTLYALKALLSCSVATVASVHSSGNEALVQSAELGAIASTCASVRAPILVLVEKIVAVTLLTATKDTREANKTLELEKYIAAVVCEYVLGSCSRYCVLTG